MSRSAASARAWPRRESARGATNVCCDLRRTRMECGRHPAASFSVVRCTGVAPAPASRSARPPTTKTKGARARKKTTNRRALPPPVTHSKAVENQLRAARTAPRLGGLLPPATFATHIMSDAVVLDAPEEGPAPECACAARGLARDGCRSPCADAFCTCAQPASRRRFARRRRGPERAEAGARHGAIHAAGACAARRCPRRPQRAGRSASQRGDLV